MPASDITDAINTSRCSRRHLEGVAEEAPRKATLLEVQDNPLHSHAVNEARNGLHSSNGGRSWSEVSDDYAADEEVHAFGSEADVRELNGDDLLGEEQAASHPGNGFLACLVYRLLAGLVAAVLAVRSLCAFRFHRNQLSPKATRLLASMRSHLTETKPEDEIACMLSFLLEQQAADGQPDEPVAGPPQTTAPPPATRCSTAAKALPFNALLETLAMHCVLALEMQAAGIETLEDLVGAGKPALAAVVQRVVPHIVEQLSVRLAALLFTKPTAGMGHRPDGSRRNFMVALQEMVGEPAADAEQQVEQETRRLFAANPGTIVDGLRQVCITHLDLWRHADAWNYQPLPGAGGELALGQDENRLLYLFKFAAKPLSRSLEWKDPAYANTLHLGYSLLAERGQAAGAAVDLYCPLLSFFTSLCAQDDQWEGVLEPDETGFCGFTSFGPTSLDDFPSGCWAEGGFTSNLHGGVIDSPIVRVKSAPADDRGQHTAVKLGLATWDRYMLPPLTLFKVVGVQNSFRIRSSDGELELVAAESTPTPVLRRLGGLRHGVDLVSTVKVVLPEAEGTAVKKSPKGGLRRCARPAARFAFAQAAWSPALQRSLGYSEDDGLEVVASEAVAAATINAGWWARGKAVLVEAENTAGGDAESVLRTAMEAAAVLAAAGAGALLFVEPVSSIAMFVAQPCTYLCPDGVSILIGRGPHRRSSGRFLPAPVPSPRQVHTAVGAQERRPARLPEGRRVYVLLRRAVASVPQLR